MQFRAPWFLFCLRSQSSRMTAQTSEKWSVLSIFGHCGPLPQDFRQVQAQIMQIILLFIKTIRLCFIVTYSMVFILFCNQTRHGECSKLWKVLNFKYFQPLCFFPQIFEQVKEWLILELCERIMCYTQLRTQLFFFSGRLRI